MAAIGEASAIIGVVQVGFSLAKTLNTYIGDYKDSRDSIISLAAELETTIIQVKELNTLVSNNEKANSLGDGSRRLAEKCVTDSDRLVKKLVELLTKVHLPGDAGTITNIKPADIVVSRLDRAYWPLIKPQVDVVKSELHVMKTDILLARSCIQSQSGVTATDRAVGGDSIVALAKSRQLARRLLREAKAKEKKSATAMASQHSPDAAAHVAPGHVRPADETQGNDPYRSNRGPPPPPPRRRSTDISTGGPKLDCKDTDRVADELRMSIFQDLERQRRERDLTQLREEAKEQAMQRIAVETYQQTVKDKLARLREQTEITERRMKEIFGPDLDDAQLQKFLSEQISQQMQDDMGETLLKLGLESTVPLVAPEPKASSNTTGKRRWFSRRNPSSLSGSSRSGPSTNNNAATYVHVALAYDPSAGEAKSELSFQTLDKTVLPHQPCGSACNYKATMKAWQAMPVWTRVATSKFIADTYQGCGGWRLHAAVPVEKNVGTTRKLLQRMVLGEVVPRGMLGIMVVFVSNELHVKDGKTAAATLHDDASTSTSTSIRSRRRSRSERSYGSCSDAGDNIQLRELEVRLGRRMDENHAKVVETLRSIGHGDKADEFYKTYRSDRNDHYSDGYRDRSRYNHAEKSPVSFAWYRGRRDDNAKLYKEDDKDFFRPERTREDYRQHRDDSNSSGGSRRGRQRYPSRSPTRDDHNWSHPSYLDKSKRHAPRQPDHKTFEPIIIRERGSYRVRSPSPLTDRYSTPKREIYVEPASSSAPRRKVTFDPFESRDEFMGRKALPEKHKNKRNENRSSRMPGNSFDDDLGWGYPGYNPPPPPPAPVEVETRSNVPMSMPMPRSSSPEELLEDASEAEDAALDDEELRDKMLAKYTGCSSTAAAAGTETTAPHNNGVNGISADTEAHAISPVAGVQRRFTATVEEDDEFPDAETSARAGAGQLGSPRRRRASSRSASRSSSRSSLDSRVRGTEETAKDGDEER